MAPAHAAPVSDGPNTCNSTSVGWAGDAEGDGFGLFEASSGNRVSTTVSITNNVVTVNPDSNLDTGTIYILKVQDGAIRQTVDTSGNPSATGTQRPIQGQTITFKTSAS